MHITLLDLATPTPLYTQGETLDGHDLDLLRVGREGEGKRHIWVVARQHPGESMAGAWVRWGFGG